MSSDTRDDCEALAVALSNAKFAEEQAKNARIEAEEKLAKALGGKEIGSSSFKCGRIGVTIKRGYSYSVDNITDFASMFPEYVKTKQEVNASKYERARIDSPNEFANMAEFVTAKPRKVSVELKI